jgi:hypothetical protein
MSLQRKIDVVGVSRIESSAALTHVAIDDVSPVDARGHEKLSDSEAVVLQILRLITAAYSTGEAECWELAFRFAENAAGVERGPVLVARVAALVRLFRNRRTLVCLPFPCNRLSIDERHVMAAIGAISDDDRAGFADAALNLPEVEPQRLVRAAKAIIKALSSASVRNFSARTLAA